MTAPACLIVTSMCLGPTFPGMTNLSMMKNAALRVGVQPALVVMNTFSVLPPDLTHGMETFFGDHSKAQLRRFCKTHSVQCAFPFEEEAVLPAAALRDEFNFPKGLGVDQARLFRDKHLMRQAALRAGVKIPRGDLVKSKAEFISLIQHFGGHVVVKPTSFYGCIGVFELRPQDDLDAAFEKLKATGHQNDVEYLVEKYVPGEQYHADLLLQGGEVLFQALGRYTKPPLQFSSFPPQGTVTRRSYLTKSEKKILEKMKTTVDEFGLRDGWAHAEFFVKPNRKVVFGEIAARVGGGMIPPLFEKAYGFNAYEAMVRAALDPTYKPCSEDGAGDEIGAEFLMAFDGEKTSSGTLLDHTPMEKLMCIPGVLDAQMYVRPGDLVERPQASTQMLGYFLFVAEGNGSMPTSAQLAVRETFKATLS